MSACRICSCVDDDCTWCIVLTGEPCFWSEPDLCSACASYGKTDVDRAYERGRVAWDMGHKRGSSVPGRDELLDHSRKCQRVWARLQRAERMKCERISP